MQQLNKKTMNLLTQNTKLKKTSKHFNTKVLNFSISAYNNKMTGQVTCPFAGDCKKYCYAQKRFYKMYAEKSMDNKHAETLKNSFVQSMNKEIKKKRPDYIRIHDSGDFYSLDYINKWIKIIALNPGVKFYAYTKSHQLFKGLDLPDNFDLISSLGGKQDDKINLAIDRHAKIFASIQDLKKADYIDTSNFDLFATKFITPNNHKIGLIIH